MKTQYNDTDRAAFISALDRSDTKLPKRAETMLEQLVGKTQFNKKDRAQIDLLDLAYGEDVGF